MGIDDVLEAHLPLVLDVIDAAVEMHAFGGVGFAASPARPTMAGMHCVGPN